MSESHDLFGQQEQNEYDKGRLTEGYFKLTDEHNALFSDSQYFLIAFRRPRADVTSDSYREGLRRIVLRPVYSGGNSDSRS